MQTPTMNKFSDIASKYAFLFNVLSNDFHVIAM